MLIVGFQSTICAETLVFEKVFQENELPILTKETGYNNQLNYLKDTRVDLGTIKLEIGEKLTLGEIKHLWVRKGDSDGYSAFNNSYGIFELHLKYDFFGETQKLTIVNDAQKKWNQSFSDEIASASSVQWPIEGPVIISLKVKPFFVIMASRTVGNFYKIRDLQPQYMRISFEKEISNINNNQSKQQVLVLPKGSKNMNVIMESSEDLVNWTTDSLGLKTTTDGHRFFRLRAVKE